MSNKRFSVPVGQYPRHGISKSSNNMHQYPLTSSFETGSTTASSSTVGVNLTTAVRDTTIGAIVSSPGDASPNLALVAQLRCSVLCAEDELDSSAVTLQHAIAELEFLISERNDLVTELRERADDRARVLAGGEGPIPAWDVTMRMVKRRDLVLEKIAEYERVEKHAREDVEELEEKVRELKREWVEAGGRN